MGEKSTWDVISDFGVAVAKGVYSVGEDLVYGLERSGEGLGVRGTGRQLQIARENELIAGLVFESVKSAPTAATNPLNGLVFTIVDAYMSTRTSEELAEMAEQIVPGMAGKIAGKQLAKHVAKKIAEKMLLRIAASEGFKQLAKKLGVSAGASASLVGIPVSLVMMQGLAQRSSKSSRRLQSKLPKLWTILRTKKGLDLLYFLIESHVSTFVDGIAIVNKSQLYEAWLKKQ